MRWDGELVSYAAALADHACVFFVHLSIVMKSTEDRVRACIVDLYRSRRACVRACVRAYAYVESTQPTGRLTGTKTRPATTRDACVRQQRVESTKNAHTQRLTSFFRRAYARRNPASGLSAAMHVRMIETSGWSCVPDTDTITPALTDVRHGRRRPHQTIESCVWGLAMFCLRAFVCVQVFVSARVTLFVRVVRGCVVPGFCLSDGRRACVCFAEWILARMLVRMWVHKKK